MNTGGTIVLSGAWNRSLNVYSILKASVCEAEAVCETVAKSDASL